MHFWFGGKNVSLCPPAPGYLKRLPEDRFVELPDLVDPRIAEGLAKEAGTWAMSRVWVGGQGEMTENGWTEGQAPEGCALHSLFGPGSLESLVRDATRHRGLMKRHVWTSFYSEGEFIPPHVDGCGDVQVVLALRTNCQGGTLRFHLSDGDREVALRPGSGVLFYATNVRHSTTPVLPRLEGETPERVVAVCRYFIHP